jgi:hypothetical protein
VYFTLRKSFLSHLPYSVSFPLPNHCSSMSDNNTNFLPPASPYPDSAAAAAAAAAAPYEVIPLPYGLDSIAPSSMSALTAEKLEKFRVGSQAKSRFQLEKEEKEGASCRPVSSSLSRSPCSPSVVMQRVSGGKKTKQPRPSRAPPSTSWTRTTTCPPPPPLPPRAPPAPASRRRRAPQTCTPPSAYLSARRRRHVLAPPP